MRDKEAVQMMQRCKGEIQALRAEINRLRPKADAYDSIAHVLSLMPRASQRMGEDVIWALDRRIREIESAAEAEKQTEEASHARP